MDAWAPAGNKHPSIALMVLYRLMVLRLTSKQLQQLLNASDAPFLRALGLLYLRFTSPPADLWAWFEPILETTENASFSPGLNQMQQTSLSAYAKALLVEPRYYGTLLPRLPVKVNEDLQVKLALIDKDRARAKANESQAHLLVRGAKVRARYPADEKWYAATVDGPDHSAGKGGSAAANCVASRYWITYDEFGDSESISLGRIDLAPATGRGGDDPRASAREREFETMRGGGDDRELPRRAAADGDDYRRENGMRDDWGRGDGIGVRAGGPRARSRSRSPPGGYRGGRDHRDSYDGRRDPRDAHDDRREFRDRGYDDRRNNRGRPDANRRSDYRDDRSGGGGGSGRDERAYNRSNDDGDRYAPRGPTAGDRDRRGGGDEDDVEAIRREIRDRERAGAVAGGRDYAARSSGFGGALPSGQAASERDGGFSSGYQRDALRSGSVDRAAAAAPYSSAPRSESSSSSSAAHGAGAASLPPAPAPAAAPSAEALARMRELKARYGGGGSSSSTSAGGSLRIGSARDGDEDVLHMQARWG